MPDRSRSRSRSPGANQGRSCSLEDIQEETDFQIALEASRADIAKVELLMQMGICEVLAREALERCANDANLAAEHVFSRDVAQENACLKCARDKLADVERALAEDTVMSSALLVQMAETVSEVSCDLDNIDVGRDLSLREARRSSLHQCQRLEHQITNLRNDFMRTQGGGQGVGQDAALSQGALSTSQSGGGASNSKRCYPPDTLFKSNDGLKKADALTLGDQVIDKNGQSVEVVSVVMHPSQSEDLVELVTEKSKLTVTGSHRMLVPTALGDGETLARNLKQDDWMYCGKKAVQVLETRHYVEIMSVVELMFENDAAVEAYPSPLEGLVTLGQALGEPQRLLTCKIEQGQEDDGARSMEDGSCGGSTHSGPTSPMLELSDSDLPSTSPQPKSSKGGRSRTRTAKLKWNLRRLPSPDGERFFR